MRIIKENGKIKFACDKAGGEIVFSINNYFIETTYHVGYYNEVARVKSDSNHTRTFYSCSIAQIGLQNSDITACFCTENGLEE